MQIEDSQSLTTISPRFKEDLGEALANLRSALIAVIRDVEGDPSKPQDLARRFKLNKNLTWKISKVVGEADPYAGVPHLPGTGGFEIFFKGMRSGGAGAELIDRARCAAQAIERVVEVHTGDRATLDIMVSDMLPPGMQSDRDEQLRKMAFQGNSGIWGVRARIQTMLCVLAPNADDPSLADLIQVGGLVDFRRLRADARWLLVRRERWSDDDEPPAPDQSEPLDPDCPPDAAPLIREFCSTPPPTLEVISSAGEDQYELPGGPVGNAAAVTCVWGEISRKVGAVAADLPGEYGEIGCSLVTPVEQVVFDLLVHRELAWAMDPELVVYSRLDGGGMQTTQRRQRNTLAINEPVVDLGWGVDGLVTPALPDHHRLASYVFDRAGWSPRDFRALRVDLAYPPIPSVALLRSELPVRH